MIKYNKIPIEQISKVIKTKKPAVKTSFAEIILTVCLFAVGTFHEYVSCAVSIAMLSWLIYNHYKRETHFYLNVLSVSVLFIVASYAVTSLWAVDGGVALIGSVKFLPALLYLLILMQTEGVDAIISRLPWAAAFMTVFSAIGMQIPAFADLFSVVGRLGGFFQYPNTFAVFALASELIAAAKPKLKIADFAVIAVLLFGIYYSGSRSVFVLAVIANVLLIFVTKSKKVKIAFAATAAVLLAGAAVYLLISGGDGLLGRLTRISLGESTFVGRILYLRDALPVILKHPFGIGYMGYYYVHRSVQTGVYNLMFIHNDFVQFMLDVGWIPSLLFAASAVKSVFGGKKPFYKRLVTGVIALHACFDFDFQFVSIFMLFLLFFNLKEGKEYRVKKKKAFAVSGCIAAFVCLYFGIFLAFYGFGKYEAAFALYPLDTRSETELLVSESDAAKAQKMADDIISRNKYVTVAYSVKARKAYSDGDFKSVIEYKNKVFETAPFDYAEYKEYCYMLMTGIDLYRKNGDFKSARICLDEIVASAEKVQNAKNRLSPIGAKISQQPRTKLPADITDFIDSEMKKNR